MPNDYILKSGYIDIDVCHPIEENGLGEEDSSPMPSTHSKFCYVSLHSREDKRNSLESFHFHICSRTTHMTSIDSGKYHCCKGVFQKKVVHDHQQHRQRREAQLQYTTRKFSNSVRFEFSSAEPKHEIEIQVNSTTYGTQMVIKWDIVGCGQWKAIKQQKCLVVE